MNKIITAITIVFCALTSFAQGQMSNTEDAFAMAKASGRSVFLLGGLKN